MSEQNPITEITGAALGTYILMQVLFWSFIIFAGICLFCYSTLYNFFAAHLGEKYANLPFVPPLLVVMYYCFKYGSLKNK